jgi:Fic family protein
MRGDCTMIKYDTYEKLAYRYKAGDTSAVSIFEERERTKAVLPLKAMNGKNFIICMTEEVTTQLTLVKELYAQVTDWDDISLAREAYHSATIEGAVTTLAETLRVCNDGLPQSQSEQMVLNTMEAIKWIGSNNVNGHAEIQILWGKVMNTFYSWKMPGYRSSNVTIGNEFKVVFTPPDFTRVPELMTEFLKFKNTDIDIDPFIKAVILHYYFVYIHPFTDGNGRMSRILLSDHLVKSGYKKFETISITSEVFKELSDYYKTLQYSENNELNDITFFVVYYLNVYEKVLRRHLDDYRPWRDNEEQLTDTQKKILKMLRDCNEELSQQNIEKKFAKYDNVSDELMGLFILGFIDRNGEKFKAKK